MSPGWLLAILIFIVFFGFLSERILEYLNLRNWSPNQPDDIPQVYDPERYSLQRTYMGVWYRFDFLRDSLTCLLTLAVLWFGIPGWLDSQLRLYTSHYALLPIVFLAVFMLVSSIFSLPFSLYGTFVLEERFGFNKTTVKTFVLDLIKGMLLGAVLGGSLLWGFAWLYNYAGDLFLVWIALLSGAFLLFMVFFYSSLILPLFNKLIPIPDGELKDEVLKFCEKHGFPGARVYIMNGSKRSTRANAFFTGFGLKKKIVLYDTLVNTMSTGEVMAVLAHETGHYRKKHVVWNLVISWLQIVLMLCIFRELSVYPELGIALGAKEQGLHLSLIAFGILFSPASAILGFFSNILSRHFERQADQWAVDAGYGKPLADALIKLGRDNLTNLTPSPVYVWVNYSHPPLRERVLNLMHEGNQS